MITGGFKTATQAVTAIQDGTADMIGLARALVIDPDLPNTWQNAGTDVAFPRFASPPEGGITAWYTLQLTRWGADLGIDPTADLAEALQTYNDRDAQRIPVWNAHFGNL
jgi:hypothetical protein